MRLRLVDTNFKRLQFANIDFMRKQTHCKSIVKIYETDSLFGEVTNIGTNSEISIGDLARLIAVLMDTSLTISSSKERIRPENSEVERLICDNSKLLKHTAWRPKYTLEQGIREMIEWEYKNLSN